VSLIAPTLAAGIGLLLGYSGWSKLSRAGEFREVLGGYGALPVVLVDPLSHVIPLTELALGAVLLIPGPGFFGALGAGALFAAMAAVVSISLARGEVPEQCGCFGRNEGQPSWLTALRALGLAVLSVAVGFGLESSTVGGPEAVLALAFAVTAAVVAFTAGAVRTATQ
jgi:Methylamine utilisation protein MauE